MVEIHSANGTSPSVGKAVEARGKKIYLVQLGRKRRAEVGDIIADFALVQGLMTKSMDTSKFIVITER